jgi:ribosome-binding factor A
MSNRTIRINELLQRELSDILRKHYQAEAVTITITEVRVAPDLRDARVFVSVVGDAGAAEEKLRWLKRKAPAIREEVARRIVLKYLPKFEYFTDKSTARGTRILQILDEIVEPAGDAPVEEEAEEPPQRFVSRPERPDEPRE